MSRPLSLARALVRFAALAIVGALFLSVAFVVRREERSETRAMLFAADVEREAAGGMPGDEDEIADRIRLAAMGRNVSLDFVDVAFRDGNVCVRADYRSEAILGPWHRTRAYEKRTSSPCATRR